MPNFSYNEDDWQEKPSEESSESRNGAPGEESQNRNLPAPPSRYVAPSSDYQLQDNVPESYGSNPNGYVNPNSDFQSIRRMISAAQIMALVSLIIGGVILSTASVVVAIVAYRKSSSFSSTGNPNESQALLKRSARIAIALGIGALALNAITLAMIYPALIEILQSGDYASLTGNANSVQPSTGSGTSTWG